MPDFKLDDPDFNIDELDGLSAEELEKLEEQDTGDNELSPDDQNFSINGIDDLNNIEEVPPTLDDEPEPEPEPLATPAAAPESDAIDYQAKYLETMERLANQKLLDDAAVSAAGTPSKEPTPADTRTAYERAMETVSLNSEQQTRFDELSEFDQDAADDFKERVKEKQVVAAMLERQEQQEQDKIKVANHAHKSEQQKFNDAIHESVNLSAWQKDGDTWDDVQGMHKRLMRDPEYAGADTAGKMKKLETRFAAFAGVDSDQKPVKSEVPPVDNPAAAEKIAAIENKVTPPTSLSSVSGTDPDGKPGRIKLDNSSDAIDIQYLMDRAAESDDPEAIDKLLSSVDVG